MNRAEYVAALRAERDYLATHGTRLNPRRLVAVQAELDQYRDEPAAPRIEAAVPGPISRARVKARKAAE